MSAHEHHHEPGFIAKYIFSTDHKMIAKQYLFLGFFFLFYAGAMTMLIRWQIAHPWEEIPMLGAILFSDSNNLMTGDKYNMLFTMHGSLMVFFAITPIVIGTFGNWCIPLHVGAGDMAFPKLNMASFWVIFVGAIAMLVSFWVPNGPAQAGWTAYPPLSSNTTVIMGLGQSLWLVGIALAGTSSLLGSINYIVTILNMRCPGLTMMRLPLTTWGLFFTAILNVLWIPVVAAALFMVLADRVLGTTFFLAGPLATTEGGQPLLYQHLFWGFGHPEVYILIFPVWGLVGDLLSVFSRKPAFGYKATVYSMTAIMLVSQIVWGHHMFTSGMDPRLGHLFVILTITISVPTAIFFLNWICTLWGGAIRFTTPMLCALAVVWVFAIGGLTGLYNALQALDNYVHDTYFVVGHFHFTLAASVFFGVFAGVYYWFPNMFGRQMNETLGKIHVILSFVFINCVFFAMMIMGLAGHPRRYASYEKFDPEGLMAGWQNFAAWTAIALGVVQLVFIFNFVWSFFAGKKASANPWQATSLEWITAWPQPHGNFGDTPKVFRGPHEFSSPECPDSDYLMQTDATPAR